MMEINRIHTLLGTAEYYGITIATLRSRMNRRGIRAWAGKLTSEEVEALAERTERPEKVVPVTYRVAGRDSGGLTHWQGNGAQGNGVGIGHAKGWRLAAEAMGIDWMKRDELTQAIPPAFTEFIGRQLIAATKEVTTSI